MVHLGAYLYPHLLSLVLSPSLTAIFQKVSLFEKVTEPKAHQSFEVQTTAVDTRSSLAQKLLYFALLYAPTRGRGGDHHVPQLRPCWYLWLGCSRVNDTPMNTKCHSCLNYFAEGNTEDSRVMTLRCKHVSGLPLLDWFYWCERERIQHRATKQPTPSDACLLLSTPLRRPAPSRDGGAKVCRFQDFGKGGGNKTAHLQVEMNPSAAHPATAQDLNMLAPIHRATAGSIRILYQIPGTA